MSSYLEKKKLIHEFKICENFHPVVFMYMKKASLYISKLEEKKQKSNRRALDQGIHALLPNLSTKFRIVRKQRPPILLYIKSKPLEFRIEEQVI